MHHLDTASAAALTPALRDEWGATVSGFLAHCRSTPEHLGRVLEGAPAFALAHATKGFFLLLLGRSELVGPARASLAEADRLARTAPQDEPHRLAAFIEALTAYAAGRPSAATARLGQWLDEAPDDMLALKL
ncbi:MAG: tetratricopeptide repeat protein, partial [Pseudomonadota bacterium]